MVLSIVELVRGDEFLLWISREDEVLSSVS